MMQLSMADMLAPGAPDARKAGARKGEAAAGGPDAGALEAEAAALAALAAAADAQYHGGAPEGPGLSDAQYDAASLRLEEIAAEAPALGLPPRPVGHPPRHGRGVPHASPMRSIGCAKGAEDVEAFVARVQAGHPGAAFVAEPKIDGFAQRLVYRDGWLREAATRGDKSHGEDVTAHAAWIRGVPQALPTGAPRDVEVRGETYIALRDFEEVNADRALRGAEPLESPRAGAAGAVRCDDPEEASRRRLRFIAYEVLRPSWDAPGTQSDALAALVRWGFDVPPASRRCADAAGLLAAHAEAEAARGSLPFEIDGMVYKVDAFAHREEDPAQVRAPSWALAHKFPPRMAETDLLGIDVSVGRSGTLTPVARLAPVRLGNSTVASATLHNAGWVAARDVRVGDRVTVAMNGDTIPGIHAARAPEGRERGPSWSMPDACPACGAAAVRRPGLAAVACGNAMSCPATRVARFEHLVRRDVLDLEGLGEGGLTDLAEAGILTTAADLYRMARHRERIVSLHGWGGKSADAAIRAAEARRDVPLGRFVTALQIREVGRTAGGDVAERFRTLEAALAAMRGTAAGDPGARASLTGMDGFGEGMASEVAAWFSEPRNVEAMEDLLTEVRVVDLPPAAGRGTSPAAGLTVVFTGTMESGTRPEMERDARAAGAKASGSVSARTDVLVWGPDAGSKLAKARALRASGNPIRLMEEGEWLALCAGGRG